MTHGLARTPTGRLLVVFLAAAVALGGGVLLANRASSAPKLPPVDARALTSSALRAIASQPSVSGAVSTHLDLGLPQLPSVGPDELSGPAALLEYVSGDHHLRVGSSKDGLRVADLLPAAERSVVIGRTIAWAWDSATLTAYRLGPFPAGSTPGGAMAASPGSGSPDRVAGVAALDPVQLASRSLAAIGPTTLVSVSENRWVAGRPTYALVLSPRTRATLVGRIEIDVDSATRVPLRVAVYARGSSVAAISAAFIHVGFGPIPASEFRFTPPPGSRVVDLLKSGGSKSGSRVDSKRSLVPGGGSLGDHGRLHEYVRTFGEGWASVLAYRVPSVSSLQRTAKMNLGSLLPYSGPLFSVRLVDRGNHAWLVVGAVPQSALARVAQRLP